jgi:SAM-dependent methyltransferase
MARNKPRVDCRARRVATIGGIAALAALALLHPCSAYAWGTDDAAMADDIATLLQVKAGSTVAEIGAGNGAMAVRMAEKVGPSGHMYATEIDPERLAEIRSRVREAGLDNVTVVQATPTDTGLPAGCCDAAYMIGVYHHVTDPTATAAGIFRALRPGGRLLVNDFPPTWWLALFKVKGVPANRGGHGVVDHIVVNEMSAAGFRKVGEISPWHAGFLIRDNYCLVFRKP